MKNILIITRTVVIALAILSLTSGNSGQTGGGFEITEGVVSSGGSASSSGAVAMESTIGQPIAGGASSAGLFSLTSGFWNYNALAPTAAMASISGRVLSVTGAPISNATMYVQTQDGSIFVTHASSFGHYLFEGIEVGQSVFITVEHKRFTFAPRAVMVADNVTNLDFIAQ